MKVKFNYYLKIKKIMGKDSDEFLLTESNDLRSILKENLGEEKFGMLNLSESLIICDGKNIDDLDMIVDKECVFSICPKIYGG